MRRIYCVCIAMTVGLTANPAQADITQKSWGVNCLPAKPSMR